MALNSAKIWRTLGLLATSALLHACLTAPTKTQPSSTPQQPTTSSQSLSKTDSKTSKSTQSSEVKASEAASSHDTVESGGNKTFETPESESYPADAPLRTNKIGDPESQTDGSTTSSSPKPPAAVSGAQTDEEKALELDRKLNKSLSTFDGKLLQQRRVLEDQETSAAEGEVSGEATGAGSISEQSSSGDPPPAGAIPSTGREPDAAQPKGSGARAQGSRPPTPPNIPDGHDDDIVARQLREAAENETDPALRERLWEEYRKYKKVGGS